MKSIETIIIGAGSSGLSNSYCLTQLGREHVVLEKENHPASIWRTDRWDSFTLVTPNWTVKLPGVGYNGSEPNGFMTRDELIQYFTEYAQSNLLPVEYGTTVSTIDPEEGSFKVNTSSGDWKARNVIIATGLWQKPIIPPFAAQLPAGITQLPSGKYRNPQSLPPGAVLVVGSGQSGTQIAEELNEAGRKVYLAVGSTGRVPRRYRGKDAVEWQVLTGFFERPPVTRPNSQAINVPHMSGKNGGHTINLHQFHREGIVLLGHLRGAEGSQLLISPDLKENLSRADQFEKNFVKSVDDFVKVSGIEAPEESLPSFQDGYSAEDILSLDLKKAGISTIIWALGYLFNYSWVHLPVTTPQGFPMVSNHRTPVNGLYFASIPTQTYVKSVLLLGVGEDAAAISSWIDKDPRNARAV